VLNVTPLKVQNELPGLPANVLFMCILYADHIESAAMLQGILTRSMSAIKEVVIHHSTDLGLLSFWLSNTHRLLGHMKQFSGDAQFHVNTDPSAPNLKTFDLQEYRMVLSDLLVQIYHTVVKNIEHQLTPIMVPGILEFESISSMHSKPVGRRGRTSAATSSQGAEITVTSVTTLLGNVLAEFEKHYLDPKLIKQIFSQLFYVINATIVNNLLLRKDFCHWSKGMQVRYNLNQVEEWARTHSLEEVNDRLVEAVQICQLLQANKHKVEDVDTIYETCNQLNPLQVQKILTMYTPGDLEEKVPALVIRAVVEKGADKADPSKLMMDTAFVFPVTFPFIPSAPKFAMIEIPQALNIDYLKKI
jgi:myosin-5